MSSMVTVVVVIVVILALLAVLKGKQRSSDKGYSFERKILFSPAERSFLGVLEQCLDSRYRVFGKVRLGDLVKPAKGLPKGKGLSAMNKVNQKHVDFVVCSATDLAILGVVELDDQSHERRERKRRDSFVDAALGSVNIPIARFPAKQAYQIQEVRAKLFETLIVSTTSPSSCTRQLHDSPPISCNNPSVISPSPIPAGPSITKNATPHTEVSDKQDKPVPIIEMPQPEQGAPTCVKCGGAMVKRQAKKGPHAGKFFWACTSFPNCRQVTAIAEA